MVKCIKIRFILFALFVAHCPCVRPNAARVTLVILRWKGMLKFDMAGMFPLRLLPSLKHKNCP